MSYTVTQGQISVTVGKTTNTLGPEPKLNSVGHIAFLTGKSGKGHIYLSESQRAQFLFDAAEVFKAEAQRLRQKRKDERGAKAVEGAASVMPCVAQVEGG